jgi:hypothetical protein
MALIQLDCRFHFLAGSSGMRRQADLDSNNWVAADPYCNGRAMGFNEVLTRSKPVICAVEQKTMSRRKASVVGFHRPVCGTGFEAPNSKHQAPEKLQTAKLQKQHVSIDVWCLMFLWCLVLFSARLLG